MERMPVESPYISFVITSRNDDGEALHRMQMFVNSLTAQSQRDRLNCELIIVEWNYPPDRPRLLQALEWPSKTDWCAIRIISVSPEIHNRFKNSSVIPLFQMIAKNVGIRRSHGKFVLATNIDILFSNELMQFLASKRLRADRMYRIDRYDVSVDIPGDLLIDEQMAWCHQNVLRVYRRSKIIEAKNGVIPLQKQKKENSMQLLRRWISPVEPLLHTNACGDFTLLSKEYWGIVFGYPELPLRAMKLDGLLCYAAHYAGAREYVLNDPMRIYHIDHPARADGALKALEERQSTQHNYQLTYEQYHAWITAMREERRSMVFNDAQWGLAQEKLPETRIFQESTYG